VPGALSVLPRPPAGRRRPAIAALTHWIRQLNTGWLAIQLGNVTLTRRCHVQLEYGIFIAPTIV